MGYKALSTEGVLPLYYITMSLFLTYTFLIAAVAFGTASNIFAKEAEGFTKILPSLFGNDGNPTFYGYLFHLLLFFILLYGYFLK